MQNLNKDSKIKLNNGVDMPMLGFGTFREKDGDEVINAVKLAIGAGYRSIDTAKAYKNEEGVGKAIRDSGVPREEIFVTTKLWNTDQGYDATLKAIDESLSKLGMDFVDLYLVHWPTAGGERDENNLYPSINKREDTWKAMEEIYKSGKAKAIGVSNYTITHLKEMKNYAKIPPAVNQVEFHPFLYQVELLNYCKANNIALEAHSPLVSGEHLDDPAIKSVAEKYSKSPAQILIRWGLQHGCITIPKSVHKERIEENINIFDFEISEEDMKTMDELNKNLHMRSDPTNLQ